MSTRRLPESSSHVAGIGFRDWGWDGLATGARTVRRTGGPVSASQARRIPHGPGAFDAPGAP